MRRAARRGLRSLSRPIHPLLGSIMAVDTERRRFSLTFDDGPDEYHTPRILEVLARHGARATFFLLAGRAARYPEITLSIRNAGHEIGLHGDDHSPLVGRSSRGKFRHIRTGKQRLEAIQRERVRLSRPPYGWQDVRAFLAARSAGLQVVGWGPQGDDWLDISPDEVVERIAEHLDPGSIVLLHDRVEPTPFRPDERPGERLDRAQVVDELCRHARSFDLRSVPVGTLLRTGRPIRQPWFWRPVGEEAARLRDVLAESEAKRPSEVHHSMTPRPLDPPDADGGTVPMARDALAEE
jgi:peptidoglycan/xylan/chitin deacetylase (PgdA/CDA1 family)